MVMVEKARACPFLCFQDASLFVLMPHSVVDWARIWCLVVLQLTFTCGSDNIANLALKFLRSAVNRQLRSKQKALIT